MAVQERAEMHWTTHEGKQRRHTIEIFGTSAKGMGIYLSFPLSAGLNVMLVRSEGPPIPAVVHRCEEDAVGYRATLRVFWPERRRFDRLEVNARGVLYWSDFTGHETSAEIVIRDANQWGVGIEAPSEVPVPSLVRLRIGDVRHYAFTCYCNRHHDQYTIGLQFAEAAHSED